MLTAAQKTLQFGRFALNPNTAGLSCDGSPIPLRPKSFDVLLYLVRNPGRVVTKDELMERVWPSVFVTDNSLVQCISDIRLALADGKQTILKTVARRGYLFAATVIECDEPTPQASEAPSLKWPKPQYPRRLVLYAGVLVAGLALLMAAATAWLWHERTIAQSAVPTPPGARISIAVLPFVTLGNTAADDYFAAGLTEDIIAALGRFGELSVMSPNSVLPYKDKPVPPQAIGRALNVRYLATGSVRRDPERVRVAIQLTNTADGRLLWADQYDREAAGIFEIQDDIARRITGTLAVQLASVEGARLSAKPPQKLEAYDLVLRGRYYLSRLTRSATSQARDMFERAVALDPSYAAGYVGLGTVDLRAIHHGWTDEPAALLRRAKTRALKAIALDEFDPHAHALLGRIYARSGDYDRAVDALKRAMALNSSDSDNYAGLGDALLWSGDIKGAIAALQVANQLDPQLSTQDLFNLGAAYFLSNDNVGAAQIFERAVARNEGNAFVQAMLAATYEDAGRPEQARRAFAEVSRLNPFFNLETFGSLFRNPAHRRKIITALQKAAH